MLSAYKGDLPYIFISYAHKDSETVLPVIRKLQEQGYRIWFDEGIEAGTEWSNNIAAHLKECSAFLFFASANSAKSENCLDEIAFAKAHQKPSLIIFLEEKVVLPEGTEMQTARFQRMFYSRHQSQDTFVQKLSEASMLDVCRQTTEAKVAPVQPSVEEKMEKPAEPAEPAAKPAAAKKEKSAGFGMLRLPCLLLELSYSILGPFALELFTMRTGNPFYLFFLMLIPHVLIAVINMMLITKLGPRLKMTAAEQEQLGLECLVCWGVSVIMALVFGTSAVSYQLGGFLRFLITLGLNAAPAVVTIFIYFLTIGSAGKNN